MTEILERDSEPTKALTNKTLYVVLGLITLTLLGGFLLKGQCLGPWDGRQFSRLCYNDIQPLYWGRQIARGVFPYISVDSSGGTFTNGAVEYPVLTGLFMWLMGRFVSNDVNGYLIVTAFALVPFAVWTAVQLARLAGLRAVLWAAAPAIVFYAFHNWDLLAVAAAVAGIALWNRHRPLRAAIAFGIGGALKMFPLIFLVPLLLHVWKRAGWKSGWKEAARVAIVGASTWLLINLPFMLINFDGWFATYRFHGLRGPNLDSIWNLRFPALPVSDLNLWSAGLTILSFVVVIAVGLRRSSKEGEFPFLQVSGALLAAFLLWNKVHSPQFTLWLLPFFVLLRVHVLWWVAYATADLLVYIGVFRFFYATQFFAVNPEPAFEAMRFGVYGRAGLLAALIVVFVTSRRADQPAEESAKEEVVSHPPPTVDPVGEQAPA